MEQNLQPQPSKSRLFADGLNVLANIVTATLKRTAEKTISDVVRTSIVKTIGGLEPTTFLYPSNTEQVVNHLWGSMESRTWLIKTYSRLRLTCYAEAGMWEDLVEAMALAYGVPPKGTGSRKSILGLIVKELPTVDDVRGLLRDDPWLVVLCMLGSMDVEIARGQ